MMEFSCPQGFAPARSTTTHKLLRERESARARARERERARARARERTYILRSSLTNCDKARGLIGPQRDAARHARAARPFLAVGSCAQSCASLISALCDPVRALTMIRRDRGGDARRVTPAADAQPPAHGHGQPPLAQPGFGRAASAVSVFFHAPGPS